MQQHLGPLPVRLNAAAAQGGHRRDTHAAVRRDTCSSCWMLPIWLNAAAAHTETGDRRDTHAGVRRDTGGTYVGSLAVRLHAAAAHAGDRRDTHAGFRRATNVPHAGHSLNACRTLKTMVLLQRKPVGASKSADPTAHCTAAAFTPTHRMFSTYSAVCSGTVLQQRP